MNSVKARVVWLDPKEGGRSSPPPGPVYSTVARFEQLADRWPNEAWSVVIEISSEGEQANAVVSVRLLAPEDAPPGLLDLGSRFDLFEGRRRVAYGEVIDPGDPDSPP